MFEGEPNLNPRFLTTPRLLLQPHHASGTVETRRAMGQLLRDNLAAHFAGRPLPRRSSDGMRPQNNAAWLLLLPALAIMGFVAVVPLVTVLNFSLHDIFSLQDIHWIGLEWFAQITASERFHASLARSLLFSAIVLSIQVPLGIAVALLLTRMGRFGIVGLMLVALPLVVPWNMIPIMWLNLIDPAQWPAGADAARRGFRPQVHGSAHLGADRAMDTWHWLGLVVILAYAGLSAIPRPYYQAAAIDGASRLAVFRHIELPRIAGALAIVLLLRFVDSFLIYTEAFSINAGGPSGATTFLALDLGEDIKGFSYGSAAARSMVYVLIVMTVCWAFVKITDTIRRDGPPGPHDGDRVAPGGPCRAGPVHPVALRPDSDAELPQHLPREGWPRGSPRS